MHHIEEKLEILNNWLVKKNKMIELHIIGGYAIELHGISIGRRTEDIDNINKITDDEIVGKIQEIGEKKGEPAWFDFAASSLALPDGYELRLKEVDNFSNISLKILDLKDIVILKVAAYNDRYYRGIERDLTDLIAINPYFHDIECGLQFILEKHGSELPDKFFKELELNINELREYLKEIFNEG